MKQLVVAGNPVSHSLSPVMHNAALKVMGLEHEYNYRSMLLSPAKLESFVEQIRSGSIEGANVTIPFKTDVISLLSSVSEEAVAVGAVNTICRRDNEVEGLNTDVQGFLNTLQENDVKPGGYCVTLIGAGGAARAVAYALVTRGISKIEILNRSKSRAKKLAASIKKHGDVDIDVGSISNYKSASIETDLLVNCTPIGMADYSLEKSPVEKIPISNTTVVMDLVYNPRMTRLLHDANQAGCKIIDGLGMLVHQGAISLELWLGLKPPLETMRNAVIQSMGE